MKNMIRWSELHSLGYPCQVASANIVGGGGTPRPTGCVRIGLCPIQAVKPTFSATAGARDGGVPSQARAGCPFAAAHSGKVRQAPVWHSHCRRPDYFLEQYTASVSTES